MTRLHRWWLPALFTSALAFAACGGDDDGEKTNTDGGGVDGGGVDASTIKDASTSDAGGDASVAGLQCKTPANAKCGPYTSPLGTPAEPCCYSGPYAGGTADSMCSGKYMGVCLPPAVNDARCDDITLPVVGLQKGCCAPNGRCGINSNASGLGCPDLETTEATIKMALATFSIMPASAKRACAAADAGTSMQTLGKVGLDAGL